MPKQDECGNVLCRLSAIEGLEREKVMAEKVLSQHNHLGRVMLCMSQCGRPQCFYAQCNFKYDAADDFNMKFCCAMPALLNSQLLSQMISDHQVKLVVVQRPDMMRILSDHLVVSSQRDLLHLATEQCGLDCKLPVRIGSSLTSLFKRLVKS